MTDAPALPVCTHADRPRRALGLCAPCYYRYWRALTKHRHERLRKYVAQHPFETTTAGA